jgi:cytochrome c oxidase subunit 2
MSDDAPRAAHAPRHLWRIFAIWAVLSAILDPVYWFVLGPHVPPGAMTNTATGQQFDFNVLFLMGFPVMLGVWVYMGYAMVQWRASRPGLADPVGGPAARGHARLQIAWIGGTTVMVMAVFLFGLIELVVPAGAGGGEGPNPIWTPSSHTILPVQVIGQQWRWTFRYPTFGGFETSDLMLPDDTTIQFHVTSLDVIHSFWAYQLGVKADANPAMDNVAFTTTQQDGTFLYQCSELCGIWHGSMYNFGTVVPKAQFESWAKATEQRQAAATKLLPPFALTYVPDANGADGGYYPDNVDPYSPVEQYGAPSPSH